MRTPQLRNPLSKFLARNYTAWVRKLQFICRLSGTWEETSEKTDNRRISFILCQINHAFSIPDEYSRLSNGENFLLRDSGTDDPNRILIFGTERNNLQSWKMRSTGIWTVPSKLFPELFFQLYTVEIQAFGSIVPRWIRILKSRFEVYLFYIYIYI